MTEETVTLTDGPWLRAYVWWCGDYECDCLQPVIEKCWWEKVEPWPYAGLGTRFGVERLWQGEFVSGDEYTRGGADDPYAALEAARTSTLKRLMDETGLPLRED